MNNDINIYDFFLSFFFFFFFNNKIDTASTIGKLNRRDNDGMMDLNFINFVNSILIWLWDRRIPWRVLNIVERI